MRLLKAIAAALLAVFMPKAFAERDETLRPEHRVPDDVVHFGGPRDNPHVGPGSSEYLRRQWDHDNGYADYS